MSKKLYIAFVLSSSCVMLLSMMPALAINYGSGTYGSCQYETCSISLSANGSVSLDVTPTPGGACTIQSDTAAVFTDNSNGFSLTLANNSVNTALINGASTIAASSGSLASPAALAISSWGYRVDGTGGFGAGPTSSGTNIAPSGTTFAGVPASNVTAHTIANTSVAANPTVNTVVWYGVCANTDVTNGAYTAQVTYTAVTN